MLLCVLIFYTVVYARSVSSVIYLIIGLADLRHDYCFFFFKYFMHLIYIGNSKSTIISVEIHFTCAQKQIFCRGALPGRHAPLNKRASYLISSRFLAISSMVIIKKFKKIYFFEFNSRS